METSTFTLAPATKTLEDPLSHLPCSTILSFRKKEMIFIRGERSSSIYLVISGKVRVCRASEGHSEVLLDIYQADEFFGESALIGQPHADTAVALEDTQVMSWTIRRTGTDCRGTTETRDCPVTAGGAAIRGIWQPD